MQGTKMLTVEYVKQDKIGTSFSGLLIFLHQKAMCQIYFWSKGGKGRVYRIKRIIALGVIYESRLKKSLNS